MSDPRFVAHLIGHPVVITVECGCSRVLDIKLGWLIDKFGVEVTMEEAERRMICRTCGKRPSLRATGEWGVTGGRDNRVDPPRMPDWVNMKG